MADRKGQQRSPGFETLEHRIVQSTLATAAAVEAREPGLVLRSSNLKAEFHQDVILTAAMSSPTGKPIVAGRVQFIASTLQPRVLGQVSLNKFGAAAYSTHVPAKIGTYVVLARYLPPAGHKDLTAVSQPVSITVTPLAVTSFRVQPLSHIGKVGQPVSFKVTALDALHQVVPTYTGTIQITSPTDSPTTFSKQFYIGLTLPPPIPWTLGSANFKIQTYQFQPSDQGTHTFYSTVTFGKAGAEVVQVHQVNNKKISGRGIWAIA